MKISLFYEFALPRPWVPDDERVLLQECLDEVEAADKAGFSTVWLTEHHFLEEYCHSTAPEIFLAAASQRTKNIRLGFGIMHLPPAVNHPARVAERIATLDLLSNGRVEFGTGESSSVGELGGFNIDPADKRAQWEEALEVAIRCMIEEPFAGFKGEHIQMPARNVIPKPMQKTPSTGLGRVHAAVQRADGRPKVHRRTEFRLHRSRTAHGASQRLLQGIRRERRAGHAEDQPEHPGHRR
jgi:alkanesulfonate monooxygenase SsuD/methylene tetrahydromethanopterin reductase-like flavin-dependent oxidoreductase (luciferase family)